MSRSQYYYAHPTRDGHFTRHPNLGTANGNVDYDQYATEEWAIIIAMFRWYPDIMESICEGDRCEYHNSFIQAVMKRYMARYGETFTYGCRGLGKTTDIISDKCNKGILWPGEITGYYAPTAKQAAPLASKAFAGYSRNYPILAEHWIKKNDARDHFAIVTSRGSKFIMDIDRGIDTSGVVAEECGQEEGTPFNFEDFNQVVLGTNRLQCIVDGRPDPRHLDGQVHYITSASRKENTAYTTYLSIRRDMCKGESAYAVSIPWQVPVLCKMKPLIYYLRLRKKLTAEQFMRECESKCTGTIESPIVSDTVLRASRQLMAMEDRHCGNENVQYIIGYDVSSRDHANNALSATAVLKCETQFETYKAGQYRKSLVYVDADRPPGSAIEHARYIKKRWYDYTIQGKSTALVVIDARAYGQSVVEQLHMDLGDGLPALKTINDDAAFSSLVREGALPVIYPMQATGMSGDDPNSEMIDYIEREFENRNLYLLTPNFREGASRYKLLHGIKDDIQDTAIERPYLKTTELCKQIGNLQKKKSALGWREQEISKYIQKDMWSALLYACRMAQRLEREGLYKTNSRGDKWKRAAEEGIVSSGRVRTVKQRSIRRLGRWAIK